MKLFAGLLVISVLLGAESPRLVYTREQPGSKPEYIQVTLERDGRGTYKEATDQDPPLEFRLRPEETEAIFALVERLERFRKPLDAGLQVGNVGLKRFRYEAGNEAYETEFRYSRNPDARLLADWFARISETEQHYLDLQRCLEFNKLGAHEVLLHLQISLEKNRLVAAEQFLPLLDRIAADETYLNMARKRAQLIADRIRQQQATSARPAH